MLVRNTGRQESYFKNRKLLHKLESGDCGLPFATEYIDIEQKHLLEQFDKLIELRKKKKKPEPNNR